MKLYEMIHSTVVAFEPRKQPWFALAALTLLLIAMVTVIVAFAYLGNASTSALIKAFG